MLLMCMKQPFNEVHIYHFSLTSRNTDILKHTIRSLVLNLTCDNQDIAISFMISFFQHSTNRHSINHRISQWLLGKYNIKNHELLLAFTILIHLHLEHIVCPDMKNKIYLLGKNLKLSTLDCSFNLRNKGSLYFFSFTSTIKQDSESFLIKIITFTKLTNPNPNLARW